MTLQKKVLKKKHLRNAADIIFYIQVDYQQTKMWQQEFKEIAKERGIKLLLVIGLINIINNY